MTTRTPKLNKCIEEAKASLKEYIEESVTISDSPQDIYLDGFVDGWTKAIELLGSNPTAIH